MIEFDRRLAIAIDAARSVAEARGRQVDVGAVRESVLVELDTLDLVAVITRGLAGDATAKQALGVLLLRLAGRLQDLEAFARSAESGLWRDGPRVETVAGLFTTSQPGKPPAGASAGSARPSGSRPLSD